MLSLVIMSFSHIFSSQPALHEILFDLCGAGFSFFNRFTPLGWNAIKVFPTVLFATHLQPFQLTNACKTPPRRALAGFLFMVP
jgi:hypothetical protein